MAMVVVVTENVPPRLMTWNPFAPNEIEGAK